MIRGEKLSWTVVAVVSLLAAPARAQQVVTVTVPAGIAFNVINVSATTTGTPSSAVVSFSNPLLFAASQRLNMSVQADSSTFAGPGTTHIAASKVSWTATAAVGTASNGTLGSGAYVQVYRSRNNLNAASTGSVTMTWTLASVVAAGLRAGTHTLTVRWKFEAL
jgi:hypothetical protein